MEVKNMDFSGKKEKGSKSLIIIETTKFQTALQLVKEKKVVCNVIILVARLMVLFFFFL